MLVFTPDLFGSACFLVSGVLASRVALCFFVGALMLLPHKSPVLKEV